jgi:hypothetical protein
MKPFFALSGVVPPLKVGAGTEPQVRSADPDEKLKPLLDLRKRTSQYGRCEWTAIEKPFSKR